ncbi:hypothetical protein Ocin01_19867 [Orchesella cincta]|uniref:Uncharacterized protein n=1 Tax=Orchesella cincta TaxID=48709 RepID=A0A1D2M1H7_ORCCI|nr:hypothetical protein Ocin01_19867 [Orchesella cincta]
MNLETECLQYLQSSDRSLESLNMYSTVRDMFFKFNTALPSSAPAERVFSYGGMSSPHINRVRLVTGSWILAGLFLTNNYQGNNIDQLTTPLTPKTIENFEEVFGNNLTVFSMPVYYKALKDFLALDDQRAWDQRAWSVESVTISDIYLRKQVNRDLSEAKIALKHIIRVPKNWMETKKMIEFDFYISKIAECGRDVFVDTYDLVQKLRFGLIKRNVNKATIATSKVSYGIRNHLWKFYIVRIPGETLDRRYLSLVQSGVFHLWKEWKFRIDMWNDTIQAAKLELPPSAKALSIADNIAVVFYLHLGLLLVSCTLFLVEIQKFISPKMVCFTRQKTSV